ncbi:hypothetical protein SAY86_031619 [Trapa natans]|uniref:Uncharacterized protein n=1 Tax=Trapa natans TaxID=22666 RepID=A0AAN7R8G4_TRANT|nr:hypothetical protein SAY86_031619 [Trapa natans]
MGLQRKQGEKVEEGQQFDIRGTVDEFRHSVNMYTFWKRGMEIFVFHVRRRQIPSYVFPEGYKRVRSRASATHQGGKTSSDDGDGSRQLKRKKDLEDDDVKQMASERCKSFSPEGIGITSPEVFTCHKLVNLSSESPIEAVGNQENSNYSTPIIGALREPRFMDVEEQQQRAETIEGGSSCNSCAVTTPVCEVRLIQSMGHEGNSQGEGSAEGSNHPGSLATADSCEADSMPSMVGLQEESKPKAALGIALTLAPLDPDVQKPVISMTAG